jgi:flagellar motor protein MotB
VTALWLLWATGCGPVHRYPDGTGIEGQLEREVVALKMRIAELEQGGAVAPTGPDPLLTELSQVFSGSDVTVADTPEGVLLLVPARAVFAELHPPRARAEAAMIFDLLATVMGQHTDAEAVITGHTSDRPPPPAPGGSAPVDHLLLGAVWAHAFATELHDGHGVARPRLTIASRGATLPVASNDLPSGQDDNERIEVLLRRSPAGADAR